MQIYKAMVASGGGILKTDAIEYEGKLWLVPNWLDSTGQGWTMPARMVRFDHLPHADTRGKADAWDFVISSPMPKELMGDASPQGPIPGHEYRELPDVRIPLAPKAKRTTTH